MTARDPIKCNCQRQINSCHELKGLLEFFDLPVLLRSSNGKVICHNSHFLCLASRVGDISFSFQNFFSDEKYKKIISGENYVLTFPGSVLIVEDVFFQFGNFNVILTTLNIYGLKYVAWYFASSANYHLIKSKFEKGNDSNEELLARFYNISSGKEMDVLQLYFMGFSHNTIAKELSIKVSRSKFITTKIKKFFNVRNRDELIVKLGSTQLHEVLKYNRSYVSIG